MADVVVRTQREGETVRLTPAGPFDLAHATTAAREIANAEKALNGCRAIEMTTRVDFVRRRESSDDAAMCCKRFWRRRDRAAQSRQELSCDRREKISAAEANSVRAGSVISPPMRPLTPGTRSVPRRGPGRPLHLIASHPVVHAGREEIERTKRQKRSARPRATSRPGGARSNRWLPPR